MKRNKSIIAIILMFSLVVCEMFVCTATVSAAPPPDWAFNATSENLNNALVTYCFVSNTSGFITRTNAASETGILEHQRANIGGTINGLEYFTQVDEIILGGNQLEGSIPSALGNLNKLKYLTLAENKLTGPIPPTLGNLNSLTGLNLENNQLSGGIPADLGNLTNLNYLNLSQNGLSGQIPSDLGNLANLKEALDLSSNQLSGGIPADLGKLTNLYRLHLGNNQLSGGIPADLGKLTNLINLTLYNNQLSGEIPSDLGKLTNLNLLALNDNQLTGEIPASLGNLSGYELMINLDNNQLSGEIPSTLGNTSAMVLSLNNNQLSGEIPSTLGNLNLLSTLYLSNNQLSGQIPSSLSRLSNLLRVDLSNNQLTSLDASTYNFIKNIPNYKIGGQRHTENLTNPGVTNKDYEFVGLPAYEQFPNYGITFTYTLHLPDGTTTNITPTISNGKVTVPSSNLTQVGSYILVAYGTSSDTNFTDIEYKTNFSISDGSDGVNYISASANGENNKQTSTKITINLSKIPDVGELSINDITLASNTRALLSINKDKLTSLGGGKYELEITGTWDEGTIINVTLSKAGTIFTPNTHAVTLHKKLEIQGGYISGNSSNDDYVGSYSGSFSTSINTTSSNSVNSTSVNTDNSTKISKTDPDIPNPGTGYNKPYTIILFVLFVSGTYVVLAKKRLKNK